MKNLWLYNVSKPIQFILVFTYLLEVLNIDRIKLKAWLGAGCAIGIALLFAAKFDSYNSLEDAIFNTVIVGLCVLYFKRMIESETPVTLSSSEFWFCCGLFIFYGTSLWFAGTLEFMIENNLPLARKFFYILVANSYIFYCIIIYALLSSRPKNAHG